LPVKPRVPTPVKHPEEARRLAALHALNILDTGTDERFDRITKLAQRVFGTQAAQVNLLDEDRVWFKSSLGFGGEEVPRELSFCTHTVLRSEATVVDDARDDPRFADNPYVLADPNVRFYAGQPIAPPAVSRSAPSASLTTPRVTPPSSTRRRCAKWR
jgi:GAF domain-containing protein